MDRQKINSEPTDKQFYDYIVDHLKREHGLADNRMGWMLASQGFLFAAFGAINSANFFGLPTTDQKVQTQVANIKSALNIAIPGVGLTVGIAVLLGVLGTNMAVKVYRERWNAIPKGVRTRFPPTSGWGWPHGLGLFSTLIIPLVVCFAWLLVLYNSLSNKLNILLFAIGATAVLLPYVIWDARRVKEVPLSCKEKEQMENDNPEENGNDK
jgi:hypothetical protein